MHTLTIGDVAGKAGIRPSAIRYYERIGVLPPTLRTPSGYRDYDEEVSNGSASSDLHKRWA